MGIIITAVIVAIVIVGLAVAARYWSGRGGVYTVEGTITWLDPENRKASLHYTSPRKGKTREKMVRVPKECEILLDGKPAEFGDIRAGDRVTVKVSWNRATREIIPTWVSVDRRVSAAATAVVDQAASS